MRTATASWIPTRSAYPRRDTDFPTTPAVCSVRRTSRKRFSTSTARRIRRFDYLLKPVEPEELDRALNKLEQFQRGHGPVDLRGVLEMLSRSASPQRIPIRLGERTRFLEVARITHFFTQGRLTFAAAEGKTYAVDWTIAELEQKLGQRFFRIHRGTLVNLDWLEELTPWFTGRMAARLKDEKRTELTVARDRVRLLKRHLGL